MSALRASVVVAFVVLAFLAIASAQSCTVRASPVVVVVLVKPVLRFVVGNGS
jgi:hypothetical protein